MKQKDIIVIVLVVVVSAVFSMFISKLLFERDKGKLEAETVQAISSSFPELDTKYFNEKSINPVRLITIGKNDNNQPFSSQPTE